MPYYPHPAESTVSVTPSNPSAITSATYQMAGLGVAGANAFTVTPRATGRILVMVTGDITQSNTATTGTVQLSSGTGTAPANAAAVTGTQIGGQVSFVGLTGCLTVPFALTAIITGAAIGTALWLDVAVKSSANSAQITNLTCIALEV